MTSDRRSGQVRRQATGAASLFGREHELRLIHDALDRAFDGHGSLVLISGDAGIGKTSLCRALAERAQADGALTLHGHCYDMSSSSPYGLWFDLFDRYPRGESLPELPDMLRDPAKIAKADSQAALFAQVRDVCKAMSEHRPLVLVLEDVHWSDQAGLELLRYVARQASAWPMLLLATYRSSELNREHPLHAYLLLLVREAQALRIDLAGLNDQAVQELLIERYALADSDLARLAAFLSEHAEGNPFYCGELLRSLEQTHALEQEGNRWRLRDLTDVPVPALIRQLIDLRLKRLDAPTRTMLSIAAVIGQVIPLDTWQRVAGVDDDTLAAAIEQAADAHLLEDAPDRMGLRFTHALVREALYAGIVLPRRRGWHRRIADVLISLPEPDADLVAYHLQQAADPAAAEWLLRAGEAAASRYAPHDAIDRLSRGVAYTSGLSSQARMRAHHVRGHAFETTGRFDAAHDDYTQAHRLAAASGDSQAEWETLLDLGMLWAARDYERTLAYYQQALDLARAIGDPLLKARSLNRLGNWQMNMDYIPASQASHEEALAVLQAAGDQRGTAETLDFLGMTYAVRGDLFASAAAYRRAIELFRLQGDLHGMSSALATLTERGATIGDQLLVPEATLAEALRDAEAARDIGREIGWHTDELYALVHVALTLAGQGELGRAQAAVDAMEVIGSRFEPHAMTATGLHSSSGILHLKLLNFPTASAHFEQAIKLSRDGRSRYGERMYAPHLALALIGAGELALAEQVLADVDLDHERLPSITELMTRLVQAELALARDQPDTALTAAEHVISRTPHATAARLPIWPALVRAEALAGLGRADEAEAGLRAVVRDATKQGARSLVVRAHISLGKLHQRRSRYDAAERELASARAIVEQIAATLSDEEARAGYLARAVALFPEKSAGRRTNQAGPTLSQREIEVLRLLADGRSDREIAEALAISHRTAMTHVGNILNKLGVNSRTAAASQAIRQGLI